MSKKAAPLTVHVRLSEAEATALSLIGSVLNVDAPRSNLARGLMKIKKELDVARARTSTRRDLAKEGHHGRHQDASA